ncbi:MAG: cohesin domain-containing protein [Candidatus Eisenbacteria bacterium]|nr:cohesin domain-containing protein [Candidatus Eisenbacteria bacterium]
MKRVQRRVGKRRAERTRLIAVAVAAAVMVAGFGNAVASTTVHFDLGQVMVSPGQEFDMSFRVAESPDSIASFQLYLSFDPEVIELTDAVEGTLYAESGVMTWFIEEEQGPGFWHFFDTVFGAGTHVLPPGELLHLTFTALQEGETGACIDTIRMTDIYREPLPVDGFENSHIFVVPLTGVEEGGGIARLGSAYPNPFVSHTAVPFFAPMDGSDATAEIYDVRGRLVRRIPVPRDVREGELMWDGRNERGDDVPSSVYFLRLNVGTSSAHCRLVKAE